MSSDTWSLAAERMTAAAELDAVVELLPRGMPAAGPLAGIPFAVKEIMAVAGSITSAGSDVAIATAPASLDCEPVALLRAAGALPFARTRSHEHAWGITGRHPRHGGVVNPRDHSRVAGGSSGGSAALVAAGVVPLGLGTDTAGSIRIPAAFCGVVGVKPTWGRIDLTGVHPLAKTFDTAGILAASVADAVGALAAWGIPCDNTANPHQRTGNPRIGVGVDPTLPRLRPDLRRVTDRALSLVDGPETVLPPAAPLRELFNLIQAIEVLQVHRDHLGSWPTRRNDYGADVAERLAIAENLVATAQPDHAHLLGRRREVGDAWLDAWSAVDVLALPMSATPPSTVADPGWVTVDGHRIELRELVLPFTIPASLLGLPALSLPIGLDDDGLPVGLQLIARTGCEAALMAAAQHLEAALV